MIHINNSYVLQNTILLSFLKIVKGIRLGKILNINTRSASSQEEHIRVSYSVTYNNIHIMIKLNHTPIYFAFNFAIHKYISTS